MSDFSGDDAPHPRDLFILAACDVLRDQPGCQVAPAISRAALAPLQGNRFLNDGERIFALVTTGDPDHGDGLHCILTSERFCWRAASPSVAAFTDPATFPDPAIAFIHTLDYRQLPDELRIRSALDPALDLGTGRPVSLAALEPPTREALVQALARIQRGLSTGDLFGNVSTEALARARKAIGAAPSAHSRVSHGLASLDGSTMAALLARHPRAVVTPLLIGLCVAIFLAMVASGVSIVSPTAAQLYNWGGNLGVSVALEGQPWRLLSSVFLHAGIIHLAFNMWVLLSIGRLVERLYGASVFTMLYLIAGIGGALASSWWHPLTVGVGASGAIFGLFGALLAFLWRRGKGVPAHALRPLRANTLAFVFYNGLFGLAVPGIDNAAHLGGLVTGFLAGLLLIPAWPEEDDELGIDWRMLSRLALAVGALALTGSLLFGQIRKEPEVLAAVNTPDPNLQEFKRLMTELDPHASQFDSIRADLMGLITLIDESPEPSPGHLQALDQLIARAQKNLDTLRAVAVPVADMRPIATALTTAQDHLLSSMQVLREVLIDPEKDDRIDGPDGFSDNLQKTASAAETYVARISLYMDDHGYKPVSEAAKDGGDPP